MLSRFLLQKLHVSCGLTKARQLKINFVRFSGSGLRQFQIVWFMVAIWFFLMEVIPLCYIIKVYIY